MEELCSVIEHTLRGEIMSGDLNNLLYISRKSWHIFYQQHHLQVISHVPFNADLNITNRVPGNHVRVRVFVLYLLLNALNTNKHQMLTTMC